MTAAIFILFLFSAKQKYFVTRVFIYICTQVNFVFAWTGEGHR